MKLLCLSDIHGEGAGLRDVLREAADADLVILAGDLTHLGGYAEAEVVLGPVLESGIPVIAVAGNMDREGARQCLEEKRVDIHARGVLVGQVGFQGRGLAKGKLA